CTGTGTGECAANALAIASWQARSVGILIPGPISTAALCGREPGAGFSGCSPGEIPVCARTGVLQTKSAISAATKVFIEPPPNLRSAYGPKARLQMHGHDGGAPLQTGETN